MSLGSVEPCGCIKDRGGLIMATCAEHGTQGTGPALPAKHEARIRAEVGRIGEDPLLEAARRVCRDCGNLVDFVDGSPGAHQCVPSPQLCISVGLYNHRDLGDVQLDAAQMGELTNGVWHQLSTYYDLTPKPAEAAAGEGPEPQF